MSQQGSITNIEDKKKIVEFINSLFLSKILRFTKLIDYDIKEYGLLFKVSKDDYILLDKIQTSLLMSSAFKFYNDKLYTISHYENEGLYQYTLNKSDYDKKKLDFTNIGIVSAIEKVDEKNIYYLSSNDNLGNYKTIKCSLSEIKCDYN